jgi:hypothetical protein
MSEQLTGLPPNLNPDFHYTVFYKLGGIESQLVTFNQIMTKHVAQTEAMNTKIESRLASLENWRTTVNARAGALGLVAGILASAAVTFADKFLLPILGKFIHGI